MASKNNTKKQQAQSIRNSASLAKAGSLDLTKTLNALATSGVQIQSTLSNIQEEIIQKAAELTAVEEAITLKKEELSALHGVDSILLNIDEAKALHTQHLAEMDKQKDQIIQEHEELKAQLEQERHRENDTFTYNLAQQRKTDSDAWTEQVRVRGNQERDRREAFEKDIANREAVLKSKELEYAAALEKAKTFDAEVDKAVKSQVAIVTNTLNKDFKHTQELAAMQHATAIEKLSFDNKRLVEAANNYETQNKELQAQLKEAYAKNAELAKAAVDGAANAKAQSDALALMTNIGGGNGTRPRS